MSEILMKLLLAEDLTSIRITCPTKDCGAITEVSLAKLPSNFNGHSCSVCGQPFIPAGADKAAEHIKNLARSLQGLVGLKKDVAIEIVASGKAKQP